MLCPSSLVWKSTPEGRVAGNSDSTIKVLSLTIVNWRHTALLIHSDTEPDSAGGARIRADRFLFNLVLWLRRKNNLLLLTLLRSLAHSLRPFHWISADSNI